MLGGVRSTVGKHLLPFPTLLAVACFCKSCGLEDNRVTAKEGLVGVPRYARPIPSRWHDDGEGVRGETRSRIADGGHRPLSSLCPVHFPTSTP